ncbi:MAG: FkbM family methyltransferase [Cytophagales bacterium]|nr:FkbM family methyltransferase [Cytophagales bacterium]
MLIDTIKYIYNHPFNKKKRLQALTRFIYWQINNILNPYPIIYSYTEHTKLIIAKGMTGATANLYCGLADYEDMAFLLHFLRVGDTFADIGANVGAYTILASGEAGAHTICVEPVPSTYQKLIQNIIINDISHLVTTCNIGLGASKGHLSFTHTQDTVNHVAAQGENNIIQVEVNTLDCIAHTCPILLKIDVEGYETEVLNGAHETLKNPALKAIIIELNGSGARYGYNEQLIHELLLSSGFAPCKYTVQNRNLTLSRQGKVGNTLYVRDIAYVQQRLAKAQPVKVQSVEI